MDAYHIYANKLSKYMFFNTAIIIFIICVALIITIYCCKEKLAKLAVIMAISGIIISFIIYFTSVLPYQIDIKNNSYITYSGYFYVEKVYYVNRSGSFILIKYNENDKAIRYRKLFDTENIENNTSYNGTFIYSKHSNCLLDIVLE